MTFECRDRSIAQSAIKSQEPILRSAVQICSPMLLNQALYQAEPQPEMEYLLWGARRTRHLLRVF